MTVDSEKITFIVNPNAAMGAAGRDWPGIRTLAKDRLGRFRSLITSGEGEATKFTRDALQNGTELIVCVGGDGTLNEIVNGFMGDRGPVKQGARVAYIARGTGCDLIKTLKVSQEPKSVLKQILNPRIQFIDLGRVSYKDHKGGRASRYFHNVTSFGLGGEVVDRVNRSSKALGGFISFIRATLISFFTYEKKRIGLKVDNGPGMVIPTWHMAVANGQYQGGGMRIAPGAIVDDGLFHVTVVGDLTLAGMLINLPKLYSGKILEVGKVTSCTGRRVEAWSDMKVLLDMDGEQPGRLPAVIEIIPASLPLITSARQARSS